MTKTIQGPDPARAGSTRVTGLVLEAGARRLIISGLTGISADGRLERGLRTQLELAWTNALDIIESEGFTVADVVRTTTYVAEAGRMQLVRETLAKALGDHQCPSMTLQVSGLSAPGVLCEIEIEAIRAL